MRENQSQFTLATLTTNNFAAMAEAVSHANPRMPSDEVSSVARKYIREEFCTSMRQYADELGRKIPDLAGTSMVPVPLTATAFIVGAMFTAVGLSPEANVSGSFIIWSAAVTGASLLALAGSAIGWKYAGDVQGYTNKLRNALSSEKTGRPPACGITIDTINIMHKAEFKKANLAIKQKIKDVRLTTKRRRTPLSDLFMKMRT